MGNSSSNPVKNLDKRTSRREYGVTFTRAISNYRDQVLLWKSDSEYIPLPVRIIGDGSIKVCVRKRPIFPYETASSEFDVITCCDSNIVTVHDARMHNDMVRMYMDNNEFAFDGVFDEMAENTSVYSQTASPLLKDCFDGGYATCMVYGQTGSGKTFTMSSIYTQVAHELFERYISRYKGEVRVTLSFVEIAGDQCNDLFNSFSPTQLLTAHDGGVHAYPVVEPQVQSAEELISLIQFACSIRTTHSTGVNDVSSRSHAILRVYVQFPGIIDEKTRIPREGVMTLVDLAGSEHRIDSMYHSAERRKECSAINTSLMALKDILRAKVSNNGTNTHLYRKSKLTLALKDSFELPQARTVIIATVSPASKDTEHSLNTLRYACLMSSQAKVNGPSVFSRGGGSQQRPSSAPSRSQANETRFLTGGSVFRVQLGSIDISALSRRNKALEKSGLELVVKSSNGNCAGKVANSADGSAKNENISERELTDAERAKLRRKAEMKATAKLPQSLRTIIAVARQSLGSNEQQQLRIRRTAWQEPAAESETAPIEDCISPRNHLEVSTSSESAQFMSMQSQSIGSKSSAKTSTSSSSNVVTTKEKTALFLKLFKIAYEADAEITPENIRLRQLVNLMKQKKFSSEEVEYYISKKLKTSSTIVEVKASGSIEKGVSKATIVTGVPVKVVREKRKTQDKEEEEYRYSPPATSRPGSADTFKKELKGHMSTSAIDGPKGTTPSTLSSSGNRAPAKMRTISAPNSTDSTATSQSTASIFVKSTWLPRNEEEVGYLEQEIRRIDSIIETHGRMTKQAKLLEAPRHSLLRRIAKYKAEQMRAARKAASAPPPLPSETAPKPITLSDEERKKIDVAGGWRVNKEQTDNESPDSARSAKLKLANDLFRSRIGNFSNGGPGKLSQTVDSSSQSKFGSKHGYSSPVEPVVHYSNQETAKRIESLSSQLAAVKAAKAAAMIAGDGNNDVDTSQLLRASSTNGPIHTNNKSSRRISAVGAAAAPFANDLTWDKLDRITLDENEQTTTSTSSSRTRHQ